MDHLNLLKKFKKVKPDADFSARSRNMILNTEPLERPAGFGWQKYSSPWQVIIQGLEFGSTIALAGIVLALILGGVSAWRFLSPLHLEGLDPSALQAEAQAVDMQLELARIHYNEPATTSGTTTLPIAKPEAVKKAAKDQAKDMGLAPASSTEPSLEEALDRLSE